MTDKSKPAPAYATAGREVEHFVSSFLAAVLRALNSAANDSGLSRREIAQLMNVTPARLSQILTGNGNLRVATLARISFAVEREVRVSVTIEGAQRVISIPAERTPRRSRRARGSVLMDEVASRDVRPYPATEGLAAARLCDDFAELLVKVVEASGKTHEAIASAMGVTSSWISQIVDGEGNYHLDTIARLVHACGATIQFSLASTGGASESLTSPPGPTPLGSALDRHKVIPIDAAKRMAARAPIADLRRLGFMPPAGSSLEADVDAFLELYGLREIDDEMPFLAAARRHNQQEAISDKQRAWLACARVVSSRIEVAEEFDRVELNDVAARVTRLVANPVGFEQLPSIYAGAGVRLIYVESLPGSKISGASFCLPGGGPVIALSGRGQRLDRVLFTLLHESAHLFLGHVDPSGFVIDEEDDDVRGSAESAANSLALKWEFPFPVRVQRPAGREWIHQEAEARGIHPSVLFSYLQHHGFLPWNTRVKVDSPHVTDYLVRWWMR